MKLGTSWREPPTAFNITQPGIFGKTASGPKFLFMMSTEAPEKIPLPRIIITPWLINMMIGRVKIPNGLWTGFTPFIANTERQKCWMIFMIYLHNIFLKMKWSEFNHVWSGAAGKDLKPLAQEAFRWSIAWDKTLQDARQDFPDLPYTVEAPMMNITDVTIDATLTVSAENSDGPMADE